jgi:regulator of protease activity HflC (stomatin/prohibitin superfamily)
MKFFTRDRNGINGITGTGIASIVFLVLALFSIPWFFESVGKGTVKAGYRFGKFTEVLEPGFHFPVDPLVSWTEIDTKEKTLYLESVPLPSQDQLLSTMDLSVQYRAIGAMADTIISGTGSEEQVVEVHLVPNVKQLLRQAGRSVPRAELLFDDAVVTQASLGMLESLAPLMRNRGFEVTAVLFRNIEPPEFITAAIQKKKEREQLAEQQKAELARFETEQQQKIAQAEAEKNAASMEAEMIRVLADAEAYRIKTINDAVSNSAAYIQLQSLEALKEMAKDPAAKIIIMDGSSSRPIPFLNMGDALVK